MTSVPETDPGLARSLAKVRAEIDRSLVAMADNKLEARRQITRELAIDPSAEQLQTMFKMAHDAVGLGPLKELSR